MSLAPTGASVAGRRRTGEAPATRPSHRALIEEALDNRRCSRRVRYEVRDGAAVIAFSAASSTVAALAFGLLLSRVG